MFNHSFRYPEYLATSRLWAYVLNIKDTKGTPFDFDTESVSPAKAALTLALVLSYGEADKAYVDSHIAASNVCLIGGSWSSGLESDRLVWDSNPAVKESANIWVQILNYRLGTLKPPAFGIRHNGTNDECGLATALIAIDAVRDWGTALNMSKEVLSGEPKSTNASILNSAIEGNRKLIANDIKTLSDSIDIIVRNEHLNTTKSDIEYIITKLQKLL